MVVLQIILHLLFLNWINSNTKHKIDKKYRVVSTAILVISLILLKYAKNLKILNFNILFFTIMTLINLLILGSILDYIYREILDRVNLGIFITIITITTITNSISKWSFIAFFFYGLLFFIIAVITNGGIGGADIKLIVSISFLFKLEGAFLVIGLSFVIACIYILALFIYKKISNTQYSLKHASLPMFPFISVSVYIGLVLL